MLTARPGSSVGRAPPQFGVVPGSNPGQVTFGFQQKMPKLMSKEENNWGVEVTACNQNGGIIHSTDGKPLKIKIRMGNGRLPDGLPQDFYYPLNHPYAGNFKGMAQILAEHDLGIGDPLKIHAESPRFQCYAAAGEFSTINWISLMCQACLRIIVQHRGGRFFSSQNSIASSISLSNAGERQDTIIR